MIPEKDHEGLRYAWRWEIRGHPHNTVTEFLTLKKKNYQFEEKVFLNTCFGRYRNPGGCH